MKLRRSAFVCNEFASNLGYWESQCVAGSRLWLPPRSGRIDLSRQGTGAGINKVIREVVEKGSLEQVMK